MGVPTGVGQFLDRSGTWFESDEQPAGGWVWVPVGEDKYVVMTAVGHGRNNTHLGMPINESGGLYNDTTFSNVYIGNLVQVIDANTLRLAAGTDVLIRLPYALVDGGAGFDFTGGLRFVEWDLDAGVFKSEPAGDASEFAPRLVAIMRDNGTEFEAVLLGYAENYDVVGGGGGGGGGEANSSKEYTVIGINDEIEDEANFAAAVALVNASGGTICVVGTLILTGAHVLDGPLCRGLKGAPNSLIKFKTGAAITVGDFLNPVTASSIAIKSLPNGKQSLIEADVPGTFSALSQGDHVVVIAANEITDPYTRHATDYINRPMEIRRLAKKFKTGAGTYDDDRWYLDTYVHDTYTTTPRIVVLSPTRNFVLKDITYTTEGATNNATAFAFYHCVDLLVDNCKNISPAAGQMVFQLCYNTHVHNCSWEEKLRPDDSSGEDPQGYDVVVGLVSFFSLEDSAFGFARHAFTTGAGSGSSGTNRYGTPRQILVRDCRVGTNDEILDGGTGTAHPAFDTHSEGVGIIFANCEFYLPELPAGRTATAIQSRSRETIIRNNRILSPLTSANKAIISKGPKTIIENNVIDGGWYAIGLEQPSVAGGNVDGSQVRRNTIKSTTGPGVYIRVTGGNNHSIEQNTFENTGTAASQHIQISAGSGHRVNNNVLVKRANTYSLKVDTVTPDAVVEFNGNNVTGYALGGLGLDRSIAANVEFETKWRGNNITDLGAIRTVTNSLSDPNDIFAPVTAFGVRVNDTTDTTYVGILRSRTATEMCVYPVGTIFLMSDAKLKGSGAYTPGTNDKLWWDDSQASQGGTPGSYDFAQPAGSIQGPVLEILNQTGVNPGGFLHVRVLPQAATRRSDSDIETFSASLAFDFDTGAFDHKQVTLTANMTSPTFVATRYTSYLVQFAQDATGGRTVTWPGNVVWAGASEQPSAGANIVSIFQLVYDGTNFHASRIA